jgi:hypothetical protein
MNQSFELIYNELKVSEGDHLSEKDLLDLICDRVLGFLQHEPDLLMSYLYRLDIDEEKINMALMPGNIDDAHIALGKLILERQKQRAEAKKKYKVDPIEGWEY